MSIADLPRQMTVEEFLALPDDDGVERWLIRGELRENTGSNMNRRNPSHAGTLADIVGLLSAWARKQPEPRGKLYAGDIAFKLRPDRPSLVGIDAAYVSADLRASTPKGQKVIEGVPILVVEVLSPSDVHSDITEKVQEYLDTGVGVVWVIDPDFETVAAFTSAEEPRFFSRSHELIAEPFLPGFRVRVSELFD